jgi:Camelysin metallo-endopeptidase
MPGLPDKASSHNKKRAFMIEATKKKRTWRPLAGAAIVISVAAIAGQSVLASLNATAFNTTAQNINAGTLKLDLANNGNGFGTSIANVVPGDVVNRYVTLTNSGTLNGIGLTLKTAQTGTSSLITDGISPITTKALKLTVTSCSIAWNTTTGICSGTATEELASTVIGSLTSATALASSTLNSTAVRYLQMKIELPDQNETTVNGALPANTVQGGSVDVTYTFDLKQRLATTTNS